MQPLYLRRRGLMELPLRLLLSTIHLLIFISSSFSFPFDYTSRMKMSVGASAGKSSSSWKTVASAMTKACRQRGSRGRAVQMEKYMRQACRVHGLSAPETKAVFDDVFANKIQSKRIPLYKQWGVEDVKSFAAFMLARPFLEEKKIGILSLQKRTRDLFRNDILEMSSIIDEHVYDWATCDAVASSVIRHVAQHDESVLPLLVDWSKGRGLDMKQSNTKTDTKECTPGCDVDDPVQWRVRIACVALVPLARHGQIDDTVVEVCTNAVQFQQRFNQLGVGWLVRELSCSDWDRSVNFILQHYQYFSREGLRYAIEKMTPEHRKMLLKGRDPRSSTTGDEDNGDTI